MARRAANCSVINQQQLANTTECAAAAAATDSPTPQSPAPRAVFITDLCERLCGGSDTLYNIIVPPSLMIAISLVYDRTL